MILLKVLLKHKSGLIRIVKMGYSWKVCLFGPIFPFIEGYNKLGIILTIASILGVFTYGIVSYGTNIIVAFFYNKLYIRYLIHNGYYTTSEVDEILINNYIKKRESKV